MGIVGDGYKSDMAVGGLSLTKDGNCSFMPLHASPDEGNSRRFLSYMKCSRDVVFY